MFLSDSFKIQMVEKSFFKRNSQFFKKDSLNIFQCHPFLLRNGDGRPTTLWKSEEDLEGNVNDCG